MASHLFKVQISLPENVETVYLRLNLNAVNCCLYIFKNNLMQRYDVLSKTPFKIMWLDHEGDEISIFTEEDLQICMQMKATKLFIKADDAFNSTDNKTGTKKIHSSDLSDRRGYFLSGLSTYVNGSNRNHNSNVAPRVNSEPSAVQCDGCKGWIDLTQAHRYTCRQCYNFNLCCTCETKKLHGYHYMLRLDVNSPVINSMMKEPCGEQNKESRRDYSRHNRHDGNVSADNIIDIAEDLATDSTTPSSGSTIVAQDSGNKSAESGVKQIITETLCTAFSKLINKCGVVEALTTSELKNTEFAMTVWLEPRKTTETTKNDILQSTQPTESLVTVDPCAIKEFIPPTLTELQSKQTKSAEPKSNDSQKSAEKMHSDIPESQSTLLSGSVVLAVPISPDVANPDDVTITDVLETFTANDNDVESRDSYVEHRQSSSTPDWALVDANGHVEIHQPKHIGAVPNVVTSPVLADNIGSVDAAQALPMRNSSKSQSLQNLQQFLLPKEVVHHSNPSINKAIITMISMGFSNDDGWLTRLLEKLNGNISLALDTLQSR